MDFFLFAKVSDDRGQIVCHQCKIALAKPNAIHRTRYEVNEFLVVFNAAHNARNAANGR